MEKFKAERNYSYDYGSKVAIKQSGMREQLDWIKRQLEYVSFSEQYYLRYDLKKGEIYEFDWGINVNAEFSNRHYGVVLVDSDIFNPLVTVCPLKTNHGSCNKKSDVDLGNVECLRTSRHTIAVINQIRTIDKLRLYMKRAIGLADSNPIIEKTESEKRTINRLEDDKLNMIINAYKDYLSGNFGNG